MNSSGDSNCRGYEHPTTTLDHGTVFSKSNISTKAAKTRDSPSKLHDEPSTVTNVTATNSPAKCLTDNQLRHIPVPTTSPFAYNDPLLFTQVFSKFQQPLSASPPSPSSSFDGSFFGESKIPRRSCKPSDSPSQPAVQSYVPTSSYLGTAVQPLLSTVGGCSHPDGHHRSSCSGSNWHHQADDSGVYVPGVDLLPATGCPPSSNHFHTDGVNPVDRRAGRAHSTPSQAEEGDDDHHFAMDLASSPPTRSPQSSPLLPPLFPPLSSGQQQQRHHQQQQQMQQQQQHQQSGNVSVGVLVSSQTSPYPIAATKRSKPDDARVPTSQELRLEGHAVSPAPTSSMSGPSAGIELSKAAKSHNQRLKQQRSKVLPVKRITLPPLHLHLSEDGSSPLPPGWQRAPNTSRRDSSSANGQSATAADGCNYAYYYYHTRTRQTRWDPPVYPWDADPEDKLERSIDDPEAPYNWGCAHRFAVTHDEIEAMYTQLRSRILERQCMELLHEQAGRPDAPQGAQEQNFAIELYTLVHNELRQFRDARAKLGRITSDEDLYFLTKKLAQSVILKEMQKLHQTQAANSSSLFATSVAEVTPAIRQRASSYVRKYMEAKGPCYRRRAPPQQMPPSVPSQPHHHQQTQNPRARQPRPLPSSGGDDAPRPNIPVSGTMRLAPVLPLPQHHTANAR
nr:unnamed protein product [Spirometra erinaceieuropaei]